MKRQHASVLLWVAFTVGILITGCKPSVPSEFISEGDMEDILYEYHLADAMARQDGDTYGSNLTAYRAAILKKYGVTEADFDTSMVFYMRHTDRLYTIYKRIAERMEDKARDLGSSEGALAGLSRASASGDTVDIWKGDKSIALIPNAPYNVYSFTFAPDSSFRRGDSFVLSMYSDFIFQDGMRDGIAALALVYKNDSVGSRIVHMSSTTQNTLTIEDADSLGLKEIKGYFLLNRNSQANTSASTLRLMTVSDIRLFRCRKSQKPSAPSSEGAVLPGDSMRPNNEDLPTADGHAARRDTATNGRIMRR